jgi:hemerythrin
MEIPNHKHDLGIQVIDRDHREISELLVEINFNAARDGEFPGLALHRMRHKWMLGQIWQLANYWGLQKNALTREPIGLLWESHTAHVVREDGAYGLWLDGSGRDTERKQKVILMRP